MGVQESFFFGPDAEAKPEVPFPENFFWDLARNSKIYCGTSSWKFRGWEGLLYSRAYKSEADFQRASLREYARVLPMVGVDFTYYDFPQVNQMVQLQDAVPNDFRFCLKVTDKIVTERFPNIPRYGRLAGQQNPYFLNKDYFLEHFWQPVERLGENLGLLNFEFPALGERNLEQLGAFFAVLPSEIPCALELRSPALAKKEFYAAVNLLGVSSCFNEWTAMPPLRQQFDLWLAANQEVESGRSAASKILPLFVRATVAQGFTYEESLQAFSPYNQLHRDCSDALGTIAELICFAESKNRPAIVSIGNLFEGSAPLTLGRLASLLRKQTKLH